AYPYRYNSLIVNQEDGLHSQVPTFLVNVHKIDSLPDASAYISRLYGVKPLFTELIHQIDIRNKKGVRAPKFVYPRVLEACRNVIKGQPFTPDTSKSVLLADFLRKINAVGNLSIHQKDSLAKAASNALIISVKPAYEALITYLSDEEKRATN